MLRLILQAWPLRRQILIWIIAMAVALGAFTAEAGSLDPRVAAIVVDRDSGRVMYARKADAQRYPASLAKVMTLYLTFEALADGRLKPSDRIRISPRAAAQPPTKIGLRAGSTLTVAEAMDLLVVKSANDVATALAEKLAGTEAKFARRMTMKAKRLGMAHTRFTNASGLPDSAQTTTARDMAILARAVLHDFPDRAALFNKPQVRFRGQVIDGHNRLLRIPGVKGMKTGYTRAAGFNLMTAAERRDHHLVAVVLGGATSGARDGYMRRLVDAGFKVVGAHDDKLTMVELLHGATPERQAIAQEMAQGPVDLPPLTRGIWSVQAGAFASEMRTISVEDAYKGLRPEVLFLIAGMVVVGLSLEVTGLAAVATDGLVGLVRTLGPLLALALIYGATLFLTEILSNAAVAVLLTPVAVSLAESLGVSPRPFLIAVMMAASAAFATPFGYQTNVLVYQVGRYSYADFVRIGVPLNLITWAVGVAVIPLFFPF